MVKLLLFITISLSFFSLSTPAQSAIRSYVEFDDGGKLSEHNNSTLSDTKITFDILACSSDTAEIVFTNNSSKDVVIVGAKFAPNQQVFSVDKEKFTLPAGQYEPTIVRVIFTPIPRSSQTYSATLTFYTKDGAVSSNSITGNARFFNLIPVVLKSGSVTTQIATQPRYNNIITIYADINELAPQPIDKFGFTIKRSANFFNFIYDKLKDINGGEWTWKVVDTAQDELQFIGEPNNALLRKGKIGFSITFTTYSDTVEESYLSITPFVIGPKLCYGYAETDVAVVNDICFNPGSAIEITDAQYDLSNPNPIPVKNDLVCRLTLAFADVVQIEMFDQTGRPVKIFPDQKLAKGENELTLNGSDLPNGFYVLQVSSNGYAVRKKIVIEK